MTYVQPRTTWMRMGQVLGSGKEPIAPYASGVTRRAWKDRRTGRWRRRPRICGEVPSGVGKRGDIFSPEDKPRGAWCPGAVQEWMETERTREKRGAAGDRPQHGTLYCTRRAGGRGGRRGGGEVWRTGESRAQRQLALDGACSEWAFVTLMPMDPSPTRVQCALLSNLRSDSIHASLCGAAHPSHRTSPTLDIGLPHPRN